MSYLKSRGFRPRKPEKEEKKVVGTDAFQEQGQRLVDRIASHPYFTIGAVLLVVVIVFVSVFLSTTIHEARNAKAAVFAEGMALWEKISVEGSGDISLLKQAVEKFSTAAETAADSFLEDVALFYKAKGHYRLKEFDTAVTLFSRLQNSTHLPEEIRFGAYEGEAYCHLDRGDFAEAAKVWERYAALPHVVLYKDFAFYYAGLMYERLNNAEKAREYFRRLKSEFPLSPLVSKVADRIPDEHKDS